ncbi:MAG TPA: hypothetical protein VJB14_06745 [Planctomycetota bacterium]|nr:hypothetical protein [Planctomycetota bacterium]
MKVLTAALVLCAASAASADTVKLNNGGSLEGIVIKESDGAVVVRLKYATVTVDRTDIESIEKKAPEEGPAAKAVRLARWDRCIEVAAARPWAGDLRQIPATVVDKGVLRNVPYMSHKSGLYELNVYGDPDEPACLEIGVTGDLLKNDAAKKECLEVMAALLGDAKDVAVLRSLNLGTGKQERNGLTIEITPETAEDAYGGWWISVYDTKLLDEARATEEELKRITIAEDELEKEEDAEKERARKELAERKAASAEERKRADEKRKAEAKKGEPQPHIGFNPYLFQKRDVKHARPNPRGRVGSIRRFYVRGYHRPRVGGYSRFGGGIRR